MKTHPERSNNKSLATPAPSIRLVIVDDRAPAREGLRALISASGGPDRDAICPLIEVVGEACDGTQAIKMVTELRPDVVLMDVRMPGLSGLATTRLMRAYWPELFIILISFYGVHRVEAMEAGANMFLIKGCNPEELLLAILEVRDSPGQETSFVGLCK